MMQILVKKPEGNTTTLNVESDETIFTIKSKLKEKEGIRSDLHLGLIYDGKLLEDGHTVAYYNISKESTLRLFLSQDALSIMEPMILLIRTWSRKQLNLNVTSHDTIDDVKTKIKERVRIPPHKQLLFYLGDLLEDGSRTLADHRIDNKFILFLAIQFEQEDPSQANVTSQVARRQTKRARPCDEEATAALLPDPPSSVLEDVKRELATARNKEKELQATISGLEAQNKKNEQELTINARNKEKELEAIISGLKAEHKKNEEELTIARNKEKELEATICGLTHKNKVFSDKCALYESQVDDLEVENKKTKEELMNADKKYYAGARAAGYAEGLKEGKAKGLKSVEFLHHLTNASMLYFNHGFDSCQKQAEEQGFCGQLNKNSALKDVPDLKDS